MKLTYCIRHRTVLLLFLASLLGSMLPEAFAQTIGSLAEADEDFRHALAIWGDGKSSEAEALLNRALAIREARLDPNDSRLADVTERLGALSYNRGNYTDAEAKFRKALDIEIRAFGEHSIAAAYLMGDLGAALREEHRYGDAQNLVEESLALRRELLPPNHAAIAGSLNNLGRIYLGERRWAEARTAFEESRRIYLSLSQPDEARAREDTALLHRVDDMEMGERRFAMLALAAAAAALIGGAVLAACHLWSARHAIDNGALRPALIRFIGISAFVVLIGGSAFLGAVGTDWLLITVLPSLADNSSNTRQFGKLGGLLGVWAASILGQLLNNMARRRYSLPPLPIRYFGSGTARPLSGDVIAALPALRGVAGETPWFAAMEYYALILNRTYKVFVTESMLCGAKVRGMVANPMRTSEQMLDQAFWATTSSALIYDRVDVTSTRFLEVNSANFQLRWDQISTIEYRPGKKWGMGNIPHSGRLILRSKFASRELILLGMQNGEALKQRLDRSLGYATTAAAE